MLLGNHLKEIWEEKGLLQRQLAADLEIDSPMHSRIERDKRRAKQEQVIKLAMLIKADENELLTIWLAGQIFEIIKDEEMAAKTIDYLSSQVSI